jgi:glutamate---cysteine ligase / carboxylate-amine ligase
VTDYSFGIEEEYFIIGRRTGNIKAELSQAFMKAASKELGSQLTKELLQSQIEVVTRPLLHAEQARQDLLLFRKTLADVGHKYGIGILAAGTHPLARPDQHLTTNKRRYTKVIKELGIVGLGNALCGLHVHVAVPDPDSRVEIMHRLVPFLPILLALSTSSPFWAGIETGLLGYRNAANDAFPRSGFPEMFRSGSEYEEYVQALTEAKIITDSTYIWWALRPSLRHPTLELRLTDSCTAVDDAVAIAGLYRALVRHVVEHPKLNAQFSAVVRALTEENRWRAQRYGTAGTYIDVVTREAKPFKQILDETLAIVSPDMAALGLDSEVAHLRRIAANGTSAHRQVSLYRDLRKAGVPRIAALKEVCRWLCSSTEAGYFVQNQPRADAA